MTVPQWYSQPYPPEGASAAEGIRNQLGRPELDLLTILVRESAQNSWDARLPQSDVPVDYRIDMWTVGPAHAGAWRELLLADAPGSDKFPLRETLKRGSIRVLAVSDRGTRGLGGPTRADDAVGLERDFVSFIRNIGEPRDTALGGGTYGFGKGIFYLLSKAGTVLVHSRCRTPRGEYETRLIGCTLWKSYVTPLDQGQRRYTGRHWWGDTSGSVVEPLVGEAAETTAHRLGLKAFGARETGTTVVVIDPNLDELESPEAAADYLSDTIAWHLWPKMVSTADTQPAMRFSVTRDGVPHPVPDPRSTRPLNLFVAAYEAMVGPNGTDLECLKPKRHLGRLGLVKRIMPPLEATRASRMLDIEDLIHHVCLMRPAELVVTYHSGPKPPSANQGYAGVFRADESMDDIYAKAEPPTHDAWNPHSLDRPESTFVQTTFRRINEALGHLLSLNGVTRPGASNVALGAASSMFSGLVGGAWGIGGATAYSKPGSTMARGTGSESDEPKRAASGRQVRARAGLDSEMLDGLGSHGTNASLPGGLEPANGGPATPRPRVQYVGEPYYDDRGDSSVLIQEFRLPVPVPQRVRIDLAVTLPGAGGREIDPPIGASMPELVGWEDDTGRLYTSDPHVLDGGDSIWRAVVRPAPDTVTEIGIKVEAVKSP
ncbi:hypothetical protein SRB17_01630 [Streptomyces sp. RB17]|uniref:hypothetical protein n=1 Tax=Streptomyces sp. RB17 TaxID=2585197 RepID=UPI001296728A|nr:hypothetical protein [Streptomyces sp. RB17]MQY32220.1 hypothetical protein [Streptomyces sp. RB17]